MTRHPPRWFRRRLRAIDPDLSVEWWDHESGEGRWAIVQRLYNTPSIPHLVEVEATAALPRFLRMGYQLSKDVLRAMLFPIVSRQTLVFLVRELDGHFRDLDERTLTKLREMAFHRRYRGADDWIAEADAEVYEDERKRRRFVDDLFAETRRDKVFMQMFSDILWGLRMKYHHGGPLPEHLKATAGEIAPTPTGA